MDTNFSNSNPAPAPRKSRLTTALQIAALAALIIWLFGWVLVFLVAVVTRTLH